MTQSKPQAQLQRVQVEAEPDRAGTRVRIRMESYDECLGWYTAGSLSLPSHQVPLLEQALEEMRAKETSAESALGNIIPFPGLLTASAG